MPEQPSQSHLGRAAARAALHDMRHVDRHLVSLIAPGSFEAEQYRRLRHVIEELRHGTGGTVVAVSSPIAGDGKSMTAINLAGALAQDTAIRVLLVDCDLRRRSATFRRALGAGLRGVAGLTDAIINPALSVADTATSLATFNLAVVPAGRHALGPYEVLKSRRFVELLQEARQRYEYIILDSPPVLALSDCKLLEKWVDGFLLVVAAHHTPRAMLEEALGVLDRRKLLGLVFNCSDQMTPRYYGYEHYYGGGGAAGGRVKHGAYHPGRPRNATAAAAAEARVAGGPSNAGESQPQMTHLGDGSLRRPF